MLNNLSLPFVLQSWLRRKMLAYFLHDVVLAKIFFVSTAFALAVGISQYFDIPRGSWIVVTVSFLYGSFRSGLTIKRAYDRILGTILGLLITVPLWFILHFNHEILFLYFIFIFTLAGYCQLQRYPYVVICSTLGSSLMMDYAAPLHFSIDLYVINRFFCIVIGAVICIIAEKIFCYLFAAGSIAMLKKVSNAAIFKQKLAFVHGGQIPLFKIREMLLLARHQINLFELELSNNMLGYARDIKLQEHIRHQIAILVDITYNLQLVAAHYKSVGCRSYCARVINLVDELVRHEHSFFSMSLG